MYMAVMTLTFRLEGCHSLKGKRSRLSGIREKYGRHSHLAVCESDYQDDHQLSEWTFVALGSRRDFVASTLADLEAKLDDNLDAQIIGSDLEWI